MLYDELLRPLLFLLKPEDAHHATLWALEHAAWSTRLIKSAETTDDSPLSVSMFGQRLTNPLGLAAGLDKDAQALEGWHNFGFGFAEIGTVTPVAQPGNPQPRMFRVPEQQGLINRMGFPSLGADAMKKRLETKRNFHLPLGVNVGKNKDTAIAEATADYLASIEALRDVADWFVVNVSSPNTSDLRELQKPRYLRDLVAQCTTAAKGKAVLVKLAPDFDDGDLTATVEAALLGGASGIVACNTTTQRPGLPGQYAQQSGGLSGRPLRDLATKTIANVYKVTRGCVPIIGVGGVTTSQDYWDKLCAGANLVQIYTALIYAGPSLIGRLNAELLEQLRLDGIANAQQVVGSGVAI